MDSIIKCTNLTKEVQNEEATTRILDDIDLTIYEKDFTVIMGPSGAGKSTLMYNLSGIDKPTSGEIIFDGTDITKMSSDKLAYFRRKHCGFVFQQVYLLDKMSLMDNVLVAGLLGLKSKKEVIKTAKDLFRKVNLDSALLSKNVNQISGGEASRAGLVRAAINHLSVIFADEPTGALNSENAGKVLDVLTKLNASGQSIIMVTHDKTSALRGNRVIYLKDGKICGDLNLGAYRQNDTNREKQLEKFLDEIGW